MAEERQFQFYTLNGDNLLAEQLGLADESQWHPIAATAGSWGDWLEFGTVQVDQARVQVQAVSAPAQFYRFVVTRPGESEIVLTTGSGGLGDYWPIAQTFAVLGLAAAHLYQDLIDDDRLGVEGDWDAYLASAPPGPRGRLSSLANPSSE